MSEVNQNQTFRLRLYFCGSLSDPDTILLVIATIMSPLLLFESKIKLVKRKALSIWQLCKSK